MSISLRDYSDMLDESFEDTNVYEDEEAEDPNFKTFRGKRPEKKFG